MQEITACTQKVKDGLKEKGAGVCMTSKSPLQLFLISSFCVPLGGERPRIALSTALSIAEPPSLTPVSPLAQGSLTPGLSCENQSSPSRIHHSAAAKPQLFLSAQEAGGRGRAGLPLREVSLWECAAVVRAAEPLPQG